MLGNIVYSNEYFELVEDADQYHIRFLKPGYDMLEFKEVIKTFPQLEITQFVSLSREMTKAGNEWVLLGNKKPRIQIRTTNDLMKAFVKLNYTLEEFDQLPKKDLVEEIVDILENKGIIYGYDYGSLEKTLVQGEEILIAKGLIPVRGEDAEVKYYELNDPEPKLHDDGQVNYYEMQLINNVDKGEWVGERIEPTLGTPGKNIEGEPIPAQPGLQKALRYDKKSIEAKLNEDETITTLYAGKTGAVVFERGVISICDYLEIDGKVSFNTGNIDFDGYVGVTDTVEDNFSITAEHDIQVMGNMGVGAIDFIESKQGSVYIRGGISGKNRAKVICNGDFYTKFAADCEIECSGTVNIGYYALNCTIKAKEVVLEASNSKIIGGVTEADVKVVVSELGSRVGVRTEVKINGYNRREMKKRYDQIDEVMEKYDSKINTIKQNISIFKSAKKLTNEQKLKMEELSHLQDNLEENKKMILETKKHLKSYLLTKGEGEVRTLKAIHEKVILNFKGTIVVADPSNLAMSYYWANGEIYSE